MNAPHLHGRRRTFSASGAVDTQNAVLTNIKADDNATWADMGRVLGKSDDRAAAYANTASPIDMPTFLAGCREWGGRFADPLLGLVGGRWAEAGSICSGDDKAALTLATLLPAIIEVEADGLTEPHELAPHEVLTPTSASRRALALEFIRRYFLDWGRAPSQAEIAAALDVPSQRVCAIVRDLEAEGAIRRTPGARRSLRLADRLDELSDSEVLLLIRRRPWLRSKVVDPVPAFVLTQLAPFA